MDSEATTVIERSLRQIGSTHGARLLISIKADEHSLADLQYGELARQFRIWTLIRKGLRWDTVTRRYAWVSVERSRSPDFEAELRETISSIEGAERNDFRLRVLAEPAADLRIGIAGDSRSGRESLPDRSFKVEVDLHAGGPDPRYHEIDTRYMRKNP